MQLKSTFILAIIISLGLIGCSKENNDEVLTHEPIVETYNITNIDAPNAYCGGKIITDGGSEVIEQGVCWSTNTTPTIEDNITTEDISQAFFSSSLTKLNSNTTYYVRAYAKNSVGVGYGNIKAFTAIMKGNIAIITESITEISASTAKASAIITNTLTKPTTEQGLCWSTTKTPTIYNNKITHPIEHTNFFDSIKDLSANTIYYIKAYAIAGDSVYYGNELEFTTRNGIASLACANATNITLNSAEISVNISDDGGSSITDRGLCWSTSPSPTVNNNKVSEGSGIGDFNSNITNLSLNTTYYVRAYAINQVTVKYSNEISFKTKDGTPTISTNVISGIDLTSATSGASITDDGGSAISSRGVCWSTNPNPTILNSKTIDGSGIGNFASSLSSLTQSTTYYVRAYATNAVGTTYGDIKTFKTLTLLTLQPGAEGKDAYISSIYPSTNMGAHPDFNCMAWTSSGNPLTVRSLIDFDLSNIPNASVIKSAKLSLYNNTTSLNNSSKHSEESVYPGTGGDNGAYLRRITSNWDESSVNWNNQPATTTTNQVTIPASTDPHQDYPDIDVSQLIQDIINNRTSSFGIELCLKTESQYRALILSSGDNTNPAQRPKLIIIY